MEYDRRRQQGAGAPADAWAAGCLLYELLTGRLLFQDADWIRFFMRVTQPGQARLPPWPCGDRVRYNDTLQGMELANERRLCW